MHLLDLWEEAEHLERRESALVQGEHVNSAQKASGNPTHEAPLCLLLEDHHNKPYGESVEPFRHWEPTELPPHWFYELRLPQQ